MFSKIKGIFHIFAALINNNNNKFIKKRQQNRYIQTAVSGVRKHKALWRETNHRSSN